MLVFTNDLERLQGPTEIEVIPGTLEEITISVSTFLASQVQIVGSVQEYLIPNLTTYFSFTGDMAIP